MLVQRSHARCKVRQPYIDNFKQEDSCMSIQYFNEYFILNDKNWIVLTAN